MKYKLVDSEGNDYVLNEGSLVPGVINGSFGRTEDTYSIEQKIIERSFLPGSKLVGENRLEVREMSFRADWNTESDQEYDNYVNALLMNIRKAVYLVDTTNDKQTMVAPTSVSISYDEGAVKRSGDYSIVFTLLDGYWEDVQETEVTQAISVGSNTVPISNLGFIVCPPKITLSVDGESSQVDIYVDETKEGIQYVDSTFGQIGLREVVVNCITGELTVAELDRTANITPGSGFFNLPIGAANLIVESPETGSVTVQYRNRYYI